MPLASGSRLGPYEILSLLGAGGMGEVYRARDPRLHREVAIKILPAAVAADPDRLRRFEAEARAVAALNHPNVLTIHEVGTHDGYPFLATELLEGETLRARLEGGAQLSTPNSQLPTPSPLPLSKAIDYARQAATGLAAAHARGLAHRDIKPENIFVTSDGRVKILDFGLAKAVETSPTRDLDTRLQSATAIGTVVGTVGYMSPEQVRAAAVDHRTDIFSLGVVLYEMLSGRRPFGGDTAVHTMHAILSDDPPEPGTPQHPLPPAVSQVVRHCLEKNPEERFQSARDLAFALQAVSGSGPSISSQASELTAPATGPAAALRSRRLAVALVVLAALAAGVAAGFALPRRPVLDLATYRFTPLAVDAGVNEFPAWSPDGRTIAYVSGSDILARNLDADSPTTVVRDIGGDVRALFWFPDGSRLAYVLEGAGVFAVSLAGGEPEPLQQGAIHGAALSPDGTTLAMWMLNSSGARTAALWFASPITAPPTRYERGFVDSATLRPNWLAWSPDGRRLAYSGWSPDAAVWIIPIDSGAAGPPARVFAGRTWLGPPEIAWLPDSRSLLLNEGLRSRNPGLWIGNVDTGDVTRITAGVDSLANPSVSADGGRIAYASAAWNFDVVSVPLDAQPVADLVATARQEFGAVYTGGESIAYITDRAGAQEIRLRRLADGTERVVVRPRDMGVANPEFASVSASPDGSRVLFTCWDGKMMTAWIAPVGGSPVRYGGDTEVWGATWSPDGREVAAIEMEGRTPRLVRRRVGSTEAPTEVPNAAPHPSVLPVWSPAGDWIAYRSVDGLSVISPDGQRRRVLSPVGARAISWSPDGRSLFGIVNAESYPLERFDIATGESTVVRDFVASALPDAPVTPSLRLSVAPDGRSLLTSVLRHRSDIWMLER